ncbi:MAG: LysM peptidoglycan-binding domain-containing protein [Gammaproteobacteria bacterium]|nr:LysM peptidoglycan-binding domain-containing protein [Gammaproteobacteria bacterium]
MSSGFGFEDADNARIRTELAWFIRNDAYIERVFTRGSLYLPHILDEIEARGLPSELALVPLIESAYDPFAYSHGRAAGLWQFIPATGRRFGLAQNWWYDGRRDVVESTRAALDYLEYLHGFFEGDWLLALAAYNAGEGRVRQAVTRNRNAGRATDFWYLNLPRETQSYVPRLLAARALLADPEAHDVVLPEIDDVPGFAIVPVEGQMDLALAAELADVTTDEIYRLNPGFNRWATDPEGPQRLLVPADRAELFSERLAVLDTSRQVQWSRHRVASGETLITIARRYGTTVEVIRDVNELRGNVIRAGEYLMVPQAVRSLERYTGSADMRLAATQNRPRGDTRREHTVARGESLWTISRRYGVNVRQLAQWNGMAPGDTLRAGRTLVIWQQGTAAAGTSAPTAATLAQTAAPSEAARLRNLTYTVRQGDSLWRIATRFAVSVDDLIAWNNLARDAVLRPGQRLTLQVDVTRQGG